MRRLILALVLAAGVVVAGQEPEVSLREQLETATARIAELEAELAQTRARLAHERRMVFLAIAALEQFDRRISALEAERGLKAPGK